MAFDLSMLRPGVANLPITHEVVGNTGIVLKVIGPDSRTVQAKSRPLERMFVGKRGIDEIDIDKVELLSNEMLAASIVGWEGLTENGSPVPYTPEKALEFMNDPEMNFMKMQVNEFIGNRKNFFRPAAPAA